MAKKKPGFFGDFREHKWKKEWQDMPEFIQEDLTPFKSVIVHFENREDMDSFAKLVEQRITKKTKFIWYPKVKIERYVTKGYSNIKVKK